MRTSTCRLKQHTKVTKTEHIWKNLTNLSWTKRTYMHNVKQKSQIKSIKKYEIIYKTVYYTLECAWKNKFHKQRKCTLSCKSWHMKCNHEFKFGAQYFETILATNWDILCNLFPPGSSSQSVYICGVRRCSGQFNFTKCGNKNRNGNETHGKLWHGVCRVRFMGTRSILMYRTQNATFN